jgi:preprotein translocase subunit YajC
VEQYSGLIILALPLLLIWMVYSRTRRQQRALATAQAAARPGMWAMTTSGLYGQVLSAADEPTVLLEVAPGVRTRWARQAIAEVFEEEPASRFAGAKVVDLTSDDPDGTPAPSATVTDGQAHAHPNDRDDRDDRTLT